MTTLSNPDIGWVNVSQGLGVPAVAVESCDGMIRELRKALEEEGLPAPSVVYGDFSLESGVTLEIEGVFAYRHPELGILARPWQAELALEVAPALIGVGYILGYRTAAICVSGALISSVTLTGSRTAATLPGPRSARTCE